MRCWPGVRDTPRSGIGPVLATVIVAEIGDITRFRKPGQLSCWARLTSRHRESDAKVPAGISPSRARGYCAGRCARPSGTSPPAPGHSRSRTASSPAAAPQARNIAKTAAARELLTLIFYAMRDGRVRCATSPAA